MHWGEQGHVPAGENGYLPELAAFLAARSGGGPAVLWSEYAPLAGDDLSATVAGFAAALASLLGRTVRAVPPGCAAPDTIRGGAAEAELVVLQHTAASDVLASTPAGPDDPAGPRRVPLTLRLRGGQALFLPCHSTYVLRPGPGSRHAVLQISATRCGTGDLPRLHREPGCEPALR